MNPELKTVDDLRREGLRLYYAGSLEESLPYFDHALSIVEDDETRDLLTIHKASVHVAMQRPSPEVAALPAIIMRRRGLRGLAAYHLATKFENDKEYARARFYLDIALEAANEAGDHRLRVVTTIDLGNLCVYDSKPDEAIAYYRAALDLLEDGTVLAAVAENEAQLWAAFATQNLGYCGVVGEAPQEGIALLHRAVEMLDGCGGHAYTAESHLDLCLGYLETGELELARKHGEIGLANATEDRQVRNGHYLLGEVAYTLGDTAAAEHHFDQLARFYPDFPQLRNLLFAIDLRKIVNFKL
jgi:tetratricopeptide (TPR) repeat protein